MARIRYLPRRRRRRRQRTNWVKWIALALFVLLLYGALSKKEEAPKGTPVTAKSEPQGLPAAPGNNAGPLAPAP
jgi:hypothetical protein